MASVPECLAYSSAGAMTSLGHIWLKRRVRSPSSRVAPGRGNTAHDILPAANRFEFLVQSRTTLPAHAGCSAMGITDAS